MADQSSQLVQKLWNYCSILRDDGLSYGDYVEQLTFLLFLKMADEQSKPPFSKPSPIPKEFDWQSLLKRSDLGDFVACYQPENRHQRSETERFKCFAYDDLVKRDKVNLDVFWLKDESLEDSANLPAPDVIAAEIVEDLEAALEQFAEIAGDLAVKGTET